ncbi:hypothetical protein [Bombilactobacillus bombi]|uniref:hypothetical protein n=1 Tax=Bombilactobacillus bombi TaxID=1303590 RepID=UPI0035F02DE1
MKDYLLMKLMANPYIIGGIFENLTNAANTIKQHLTTFGIACAGAVIVGGFIFMQLGTRAQQIAKSVVLWACVGVAGITLAVALIQFVQSVVGGGGF